MRVQYRPIRWLVGSAGTLAVAVVLAACGNSAPPPASSTAHLHSVLNPAPLLPPDSTTTTTPAPTTTSTTSKSTSSSKSTSTTKPPTKKTPATSTTTAPPSATTTPTTDSPTTTTAPPPPTTTTSTTLPGSVLVEASQTSLGFVLATASGQILYLLTGDSPTQSNCVFPCTFIWTPLTTTGAGVARNGPNQSLLGTIRLPNGTFQVTYAGHPLYTHNGDQANATTGEGVNLFDGTGYVVAASNGAAIT